MNKSGRRFDSVVQQIHKTDAAPLSRQHTPLRNAIVNYKVSQLRGMIAIPIPEVMQSPLRDTLLSAESSFQEAYRGMHSFPDW